MPAPYTIEETAQACGLSVKYVRRLKGALPKLFEKHTERGQSNSLLFDEEIVEILKRTRDMKNRGRSLKEIRDELLALPEKHRIVELQEEKNRDRRTSPISNQNPQIDDSPGQTDPGRIVRADGEMFSRAHGTEASLERENTLLRSQVDLLQTLLRKAEERFDRLLPVGSIGTAQIPRQNMKTQLLLWLTEAVVVTTFAAGFIFLIWFFAQKAFRL